MHPFAGNKVRQNLPHRLRELRTEKRKGRNNTVDEDAKDELTVPADLAQFRSVQIAQYWRVAIRIRGIGANILNLRIKSLRRM